MPLSEQAKADQKAAFEVAKQRAIEVATTKAQDAIQKILLGLEHDTMMSVDVVSVDTRNFGQLSTEIYLATRPRM